MGKNPIYREVYYNLKKQIKDGEYAAGDFLPTESKLEELYGVSRITIRKAVEMLVSDGCIEVKQGRGTRVLDYRNTQNLNRITSLSETLKQKGYAISTKDIYVDIVQASKRLAEKLELPAGADLHRVQRIQLADNTPIAIMVNHIDVNLTPGMVEKTRQIITLYRFLESEYGLQIDHTKDIIAAKSADFAESQMLGVNVGAALLTLNRVTYMTVRPLTYDITTIRADRYQFETEISGRQ